MTSSEEVAVDGPATAVVVEFPLRGEWVAVRTPAHRVPSHGTELFAGIVAERVGRRPDDPAVRTVAGAVIGVGISTWYTAGHGATPRDYLAVMDASLAHLEAGLPL